MSNQLFPATTAASHSQALSYNGATQIETWLDGFFTPKPEATNKSDITSPSTYISKEPLNPATLNTDQILKECYETYFQVLHDHYDRNGIGGSITFLQGPNLTIAVQQAFIKTLEECEMLLGKSKCVPQKDQQKCRSVIQSKIEAISGSFKERNEDRRLQYVTRNVKNILTGVVKGFEKRYNLLYGTNNEIPSVVFNGKRVPQNKFYEHQRMVKYVGESITKAVERCDQFKIKLGGQDPGKGLDLVPVDNGIKLLEDTKKSIQKHGEELLAKNQKNQKETQDYIEVLLSTGIEPICRKEIRKLSFPAGDEIKSAVLKIKEDVWGEIRDVLSSNNNEPDNFCKMETEYQKKLNDREFSMMKTCAKFAVAEGENSIINFLSVVEEKLDAKNAVLWLQKFAQRTKVTDKHVNIVKTHLQNALLKAREECLGTVPSCEEILKDVRNGNLNNNKTTEANSSKTKDSTGNDIQVITDQNGGSTSRKHRYSIDSANQHSEYSNGYDNQGKRGRRC